MILLSSPLFAGGTMESANFVMTSTEYSGIGKYKTDAGDKFHLWDSGGQPSSIGAWNATAVAGGGWIYTISLPIWWDKDHDRDGMPLAFEEQFDAGEWSAASGLDDYDASDAAIDGDGDGYTNLQEYLARTDPSDDTSFLEFTDVRVVTSEGRPALRWRTPTIAITGFEAEYPDYVRSLSYDLLYADWTTSSQATRQMPNEDWFNQTGTWQPLSGATGLERSAEFMTFTEELSGLASLNNGDIRFYRLAIGDTYLEGEPDSGAGFYYYTNVGTYRLCSTLAPQILMVQKHDLTDPVYGQYPVFGQAGINPGSGGQFDYLLGTDYFPADWTYQSATEVNLWQGGDATATVDYLDSTAGRWSDSTGDPSTRAVDPEDGFRLYFNKGLPSQTEFYIGAQLNMDSYYHEIYRRADGTGGSAAPNDPGRKYTLIAWNYPVEARFHPTYGDIDFPSSLPGTGSFNTSDWVIFYGRDLSSGGGSFLPYTNDRVIIYYNGSDYTYFIPYGLIGTSVGEELKISPGSPFLINQYRDPAGWTGYTMGADVPYQNSGANEIKPYLKFESP